MTSPRTPDFNAEIYDAKLREADATLKTLKAQAEARKAKAEMDEISGLTVAREQVRKDIADFKKFMADDYAQTKADATQARKNIEQRVNDLQTRIDRANERYSAWDSARERRFYARLDEADAKVASWKARAAKSRAEDAIDAHNAVATLEEKVALARAKAAEARQQKYSAKAQEALEDAARSFDQAFDAAAKRYDGT